MEVWGTGIFDNAAAVAVRDAWNEELRTGTRLAAASAVTQRFRAYIDSEEAAPAFWFALAELELQAGWVGAWEAGEVERLVDSDLETWRRHDPLAEGVQERRRVLLHLRERVHAMREAQLAPLRQLAASQEAIDADEQALVVYLKRPEGLDLSSLESELQVAVEAIGGEYDGNDVAVDGSEVILYMYGRDADALFDAARPLLEAVPPSLDSFVVKRYGRADDASAREETIPL